MRRRLRRAAAWLVTGLYRAYYSTLRLRATMPDGSTLPPSQYPYGPEIFALCERDALAFGGIIAGRRFAVLAANGRDGDWAAAILEALGCRAVRGSSRQGGARALRGLITTLGTFPEPLGLVVDGPLGPAGRAQQGAAACAIATCRPVRVLGAAARHACVFPNTWSGIYLPLPFTRVEIVLDTLNTDAATMAEVEPLTEELSRRLSSVRADAVKLASRAGW